MCVRNMNVTTNVTTNFFVCPYYFQREGNPLKIVKTKKVNMPAGAGLVDILNCPKRYGQTPANREVVPERQKF